MHSSLTKHIQTGKTQANVIFMDLTAQVQNLEKQTNTESGTNGTEDN